MIASTHYSRFHRVVFVMVIVSLITTFTSLIFAGASGDNQPATES
jgi:hypothetical protein